MCSLYTNSMVPPLVTGICIGKRPWLSPANHRKPRSICLRLFMHLPILLGPPPVKAGSNMAARTAITANTTNNSISVSPLIFPLSEVVFMAGATVTPPASATSPFFASASWTAVASAARHRFRPHEPRGKFASPLPARKRRRRSALPTQSKMAFNGRSPRH